MSSHQNAIPPEGFQDLTIYNLDPNKIRVDNTTAEYNGTNIQSLLTPNENQTHLSRTRKCAACQKPINANNHISWELLDFCNEICITALQQLGSRCLNCTQVIRIRTLGKHYVRVRNGFKLFCTKVCLDQYRSAVKICCYCNKEIADSFLGTVQMYGPTTTRRVFCSQACCDLFTNIVQNVLPNVPMAQGSTCTVCKEMATAIVLKHRSNYNFFCGKRCLLAYSFVNLPAGFDVCTVCRNYFCRASDDAQVAFYQGAKLIFCSGSCKNVHVLLHGRLVSCTWCQAKRGHFAMIRKYSQHPVRSPSMGFCSVNCLRFFEVSNMNRADASGLLARNADQRNVATMCSITTAEKGSVVRPDTSTKQVQTEQSVSKVFLPIPVPVYVPAPVAMYSVPALYAVPFPLPVPVPVFLPTERGSLEGIEETIRGLQGTVPSDPCQAEILKIADAIAEDGVAEKLAPEDGKSESGPEAITNAKDEVLGRNVSGQQNGGTLRACLETRSGRKRGSNSVLTEGTRKKLQIAHAVGVNLNYSLGIKAWGQWVATKNGLPAIYPRDILQMSPADLSSALYAFVKELRKPNGSEYAPDTVYYLCLGIQFYLSLNGRNDNMFHDPIYHEFIKHLDNIAGKFCKLNRSNFVVTRVREEHLWEAKQLGCHSPDVLLNTMVFFNAKYYRCETVDQHFDVSFTRVLKVRKKKAKSEYLTLRYYPKARGDVRRVAEQHEDKADSSRCPVRLYEFYLSKCPESAKADPGLFYLQPEKCFVADSPFWFTTHPLSREALARMVNRIRMVKEINMSFSC